MMLKTKIMSGICAPLLLLICLSIVSFKSIQSLLDSNTWVNHTYVAIQKATEIEKLMAELETGERGFVIAGKEEFLEPYLTGKKVIAAKIADTKKHVIDHPQQVERIIEIETLINAWYEKAAEVAIAERRRLNEGHKDASMENIIALIEAGTGKMITDELRISIRDFIKAEENLMEKRKAHALKKASLAINIVRFGTMATLFFALIISYFLATSIIRPVRLVVSGLKDIAEGEGDLTRRLEIYTTDEVGELAAWFNTFIEKLRGMIKNIAETTNDLSLSSESLSAVSDQMSSSADEMSSQSGMVAAASEQVSTNVATVASATEQSSSSLSNIASMTEEMSASFINVAGFAKKTAYNVKTMAQSSEELSAQINNIAFSAEEMTSSLNEVAKNTAEANQISQNANQRTEEITERMDILASASNQIGKVVGVIKDIADQTNMLALNAAIEAASAGEAGKGFGVVAGEVKELARQSAEATDEIAGQIDKIQKSVRDAVRKVQEINKVINNIADINEMIASSAEEQTATASEISKSVAGAAGTVRNVAQHATESANLVGEIATSTKETSRTASEITLNISDLRNGVNEVARSSGEAAQGVSDISKNIHTISIASRQTALSASETNKSSKKLAEMAAALNQFVSSFKL
ncbi:methyl-accepting chemotaxis protein [Desulfonema magnum]|nr:methyl-accepting chemotaxis protein [Desulfonema magnum]